MANTNLAFEENDENNNQKGELPKKNMVVSLIILILIFGLYGALIISKKNLLKKIEQTQEQYDTEYDSFIQSDANEVADFKNRSEKAKKIISESNMMADEILSRIEDDLVESVYLVDYKYDVEKKEISLSCVGKGFNAMAKQILSFKESDAFSSVIPSEGNMNLENNEVEFSLILKIK